MGLGNKLRANPGLLWFLISVLLWGFAVPGYAGLLPGNFLPNADLELDADGDGQPDGWTHSGPLSAARWEASHAVSGKRNLALADSSLSSWAAWSTEVELPRVMTELEVQWNWGYSITSHNVDDEFHVRVDWLAEGTTIGSNDFQVAGSHPEMESVSRVVVVPDGTESLRLVFSTGGPASTTGLMYLDDVSVAAPGAGAYGDLDADGKLTAGDLDEWAEQVARGVSNIQLDLNRDDTVDIEDRQFWVEAIKLTYFGDANLDFVFDSADLIRAFQFGEYEDGIPLNSTWATGDWNGDLEFDSADVILAFQDGGYEQGYRLATVATVPEPSALTAALAATLTIAFRGFPRPSPSRCRARIR
ncbi:MAG: hypothetical protein KDA92_22380 [Planctomycetales bacterium]|nr:hypothetical protein [Planctomycetales bacterium]